MRVAMLSSISWRTPPRGYGPWELVTSLLTEALVARGVDVILFATLDSETTGKLAGVVPRGYSEDAGIDAKVETMPANVYFTRATKGELGYMVLGWGTESGEQGSSLRSLLATHDPAKGMGVTNRARYSNPAFDKMVMEALVTMDEKRREAIIQQAAETAMNDVGLIPIHYELSTWATTKDMKYTARTDQYTLAMGLKPAR